MRTIKLINLKDRQNYFFNDMTNVSDFESSLLNVDSLEFKRMTLLFMTLSTSKIETVQVLFILQSTI